MTQDKIIRMAKEADKKANPGTLSWDIAFANIVAAHEREACAKVCEKAMIQMNYSEAPYKQCAAAIRGLK